MGLKIWCQVWVWGTQFSKLHHVREFSSIWFQKLSFFFRLGSGVLKIHQFFRKYQVFKFTAGRWLFFLVLKVHFLRGWGGRSQAFFSKFDAILDSWGMIFNSNTRAATGIILALKHLQRPFGVQRRFTRPSAKREFDGVGWDGVSFGSF